MCSSDLAQPAEPERLPLETGGDPMSMVMPRLRNRHFQARGLDAALRHLPPFCHQLAAEHWKQIGNLKNFVAPKLEPRPGQQIFLHTLGGGRRCYEGRHAGHILCILSGGSFSGNPERSPGVAFVTATQLQFHVSTQCLHRAALGAGLYHRTSVEVFERLITRLDFCGFPDSRAQRARTRFWEGVFELHVALHALMHMCQDLDRQAGTNWSEWLARLAVSLVTAAIRTGKHQNAIASIFTDAVEEPKRDQATYTELGLQLRQLHPSICVSLMRLRRLLRKDDDGPVAAQRALIERRSSIPEPISDEAWV